jgi:hypothetical protein
MSKGISRTLCPHSIQGRRPSRADRATRRWAGGYDCLLVEDATESYYPDFKQATLEMVVAQGGIVGWTAGSQALVDGLRAYEPQVASKDGS